MRTLKLRVSGLYGVGEHVFPTGQVPMVQLAGKWLAEAGFPMGARVVATVVEDGHLVLTRVDEAEEAPARWPGRWAAVEVGADEPEPREEVALHA